MKEVHQIIEQLSPADAKSILQALAASDETLAARITAMALARLRPVDVEEVAAALYDELEALEVEEVWDRAGRTRHGYVEPSEAADQLVKAALAPFLQDLARYQTLGLRAEANRMCEGLLLGFYQFQHESTSKFKNWAPDAPINFAEAVVDAWKAGSPTKSDIKALKAFVTAELGGWGANLL
ncbi:MAG: hypothetical protein WBV59_08070 [Anaerolineae bacterium]